MDKITAFKEINDTQEFYINELIKMINDKANDCFKTFNFTSPTGTGKTNMMSLLCNKLANFYFVITTLSKGQLNHQIKANMEKLVKQDNFMVYGLCDYTSNTKLTAKDIIDRLPVGKQIIWLRDEGHINTNKWQEVLADKCFKVINFSATNKESTGIVCNFTNTMMLRTVNQTIGMPEEALDKLLEVKKQHAKVKNYNPCAIMRCLDESITKRITDACDKRHLKWINITEEDFDMSELCKDDNEYDVILNKFKIVEGIDIRRAHVLYMTNEPSNVDTTIQVIGRCRRNALLYKDDIDILDPANKTLLNNTRQCFVYYNVDSMNIDTDINGELCKAFCDKVSCQELKVNSTIEVINGQLANGLTIIELEGETGTYRVETDAATGFNVIKPQGLFYKTWKLASKENSYNCYKLVLKHRSNSACYRRLPENYEEETIYIPKEDILKTWICTDRTQFNFATGMDEVVGKEYHSKYDWEITKSLTLTPNELKDITKYLRNIIRTTTINVGPASTYYSKRITKREGEHFMVHDFGELDLSFNQAGLRLNKDTGCFARYEKDLSGVFTLTDFSSREEIIGHIKKALADKITDYSTYYTSGTTNKTRKFKTKKDAVEYISKWLIKLCHNKTIHLHLEATITKTESVHKNFLDKYRKPEFVKYFSSRDIVIPDYVLAESDYEDYTTIYNDKESAVIGVDIMKSIRDKNGNTQWIEDRAITSKVIRYSKLNTFIQQRYAAQLATVKLSLFGGKNNFKFDSKCNSCLGYLVEYYSKYLVYGKKYLGHFIDDAIKESRVDYINDYIIIRACMLKYREMMMTVYGTYLAKLIKTMSVEQLIKKDYKLFVDTVINLGKKTADFIKANLVDDGKMYDPNLSIRHIAGLADYINHDTIIDIKCTSNITEQYVKQVLAYHYLSTKRSDLDIKHLIIYEAITGKSVKIDL